MAEEVTLRGVGSVTVARVISRARVSRRLFYELFGETDECLLETFEWAVGQARAVVLDACREQSQWRERMRHGLAALLRFLDAQPLLAQLCVVQAAGGGRVLLQRRYAVIAELSLAVDAGAARPDKGAAIPVVAEGVVGGVLAVLYSRLLERAPGAGAKQGAGRHTAPSPPLTDLYGELMSLIVLPYLGSEEAAAELGRPLPPPPPSLAVASAPIAVPASAQAGARLTYRTVRVLRAVAECPGASNRQVAELAGVVDQGQISKILSRLEFQGLVGNRGGVGPARGAPNSWWLTKRGETLERDLRERPPVNAGGRSGGASLRHRAKS